MFFYGFMVLFICQHTSMHVFCFHHTIQIETLSHSSWAIQGSVSKFFVTPYLLRNFLIFLHNAQHASTFKTCKNEY